VLFNPAARHESRNGTHHQREQKDDQIASAHFEPLPLKQSTIKTIRIQFSQKPQQARTVSKEKKRRQLHGEHKADVNNCAKPKKCPVLLRNLRVNVRVQRRPLDVDPLSYGSDRNDNGNHQNAEEHSIFD